MKFEVGKKYRNKIGHVAECVAVTDKSAVLRFDGDNPMSAPPGHEHLYAQEYRQYWTEYHEPIERWMYVQRDGNVLGPWSSKEGVERWERVYQKIGRIILLREVIEPEPQEGTTSLRS